MQAGLLNMLGVTADNASGKLGQNGRAKADDTATENGLVSDTEMQAAFNPLLSKNAIDGDEGSLASSPKLAAAFMQRLSVINAENSSTEGTSGITAGQAELALLATQPIDPALLGQIEQADNSLMLQFIATLQELAEIGGTLHQQATAAFGLNSSELSVESLIGEFVNEFGLNANDSKLLVAGLTLINVNSEAIVSQLGQGELDQAKIVAELGMSDADAEILLASFDLLQEAFSLSDEAIATLAKIGKMSETDIRISFTTLILTSLDEVASHLNDPATNNLNNNDISALTAVKPHEAAMTVLAQLLNQSENQTREALQKFSLDEVGVPLDAVFTAVESPAILSQWQEAIASSLTSTGNSSRYSVNFSSNDAASAIADTAMLQNKAVTKAAPLTIEEEDIITHIDAQLVALEENSKNRQNIQALDALALNNGKASQITQGFAAAQSIQNSQISARRSAQLQASLNSELALKSLENDAARSTARPQSEAVALSVFEADQSRFDAKLRDANDGPRQQQNAQNVRDQIAVNVKQGLDRGDTNINIRLRPYEMGQIDVRIEMQRDGRTQLFIMADNRDTLDMLQRDSKSLMKAFAEMGMELSDSGMNFDLNSQFSGGQESDDSESSKGDQQNTSSEFSDLLPPAPDELMASALLDNLDASYFVGIDDSLNIRI